MAAVLANEFTEATSDICVQTLIEIGLVLFVITIIVNAIGRLILYKMTPQGEAHQWIHHLLPVSAVGEQYRFRFDRALRSDYPECSIFHIRVRDLSRV